ncbi:hypothetical protein [Defluviimonas sp. WL0050]|nr:hypothetical protein [Defluviimonas sp. WL0050]
MIAVRRALIAWLLSSRGVVEKICYYRNCDCLIALFSSLWRDIVKPAL